MIEQEERTWYYRVTQEKKWVKIPMPKKIKVDKRLIELKINKN